MSTNVINAELVKALEKCLPYVGMAQASDIAMRVYDFANSVLADARKEQRDEFRRREAYQREQQFQEAIAAAIARTQVYGIVSVRRILDSFGIDSIRQAKPEQLPEITRKLKMAPSALAKENERRVMMMRDKAYRIDRIKAQTQAARAVRPGEGGYLPAAPPVEKCTCEICNAARRRGIDEGWWKPKSL